MSAVRAGLRTSTNIDSPCGKPSGDLLYILNHLYDSECSGTDDDESKSLLRRKAIGIIDGIEVTQLEEKNNCEFMII